MAKKSKKNRIEAEKVTDGAPAEKTTAKSYPKWPILLVLALIAVGVVILFFNRGSQVKPSVAKIGPVNGCQQTPPFVRQLGFGNGAAFSTSDRKIKGLILVEGDRKYQHPSWKLAGSLAPITRDGKGGTYVGPAPWIDLLANKTEDQNRVYKVDGQSQEMKAFSDLPRIGEITSQNPYGVLGLTFDCETSSIYAASTAGSTRETVNGRIFQIGSDGKVVSMLEMTDAMGLAVFNSAKGKRLYFGMARVSEIWSVALDSDGKFNGEPRKEISFSTYGTRGDDKARRINFSQTEMNVFGIEFDFNLIAPTEKQETVYRFRYDPAKDAWSFVEEPPQIVNTK